MHLYQALKCSGIVTTGVVLLFVLPLPGMCQVGPVQAEESPEAIEEIVVRGRKSLVKLKIEMYRAEDTLYDLYNSLNTNDEFDIRCYKEAPTGSHIKKRVCRTRLFAELYADASRRMLQGLPFVDPMFEIKKLNERMLADMTETALKEPEMLEAIVKYAETKQTLEAERKRRCEGRLFVCRRE